MQGIGAEAGRDPAREQADQLLANRLLHQQVVGGDAGLAAVDGFAPDQALCGGLQVGIGEHHRRTLAAQLQGYGGEVGGCGRQHQPANPFAAGEEDVVKAQLQELLGHLAIPLHQPHHARIKVARHQLRQQGPRGRGVLRRFEHGRVARRQGTHQGLEQQVEGIVPGAND